MEKLSSTLKHLLNEANISEAELARRTGIAQPMVNRLATGKNKNPKLETLKPIAKYFSVTFSQLLGEEDLPSNEARNNQFTTTTDSQSFELSLLDITEVTPTNLTSKTIIASNTRVSDKAFAVKLNNSALEPRFTANTILTIEPESTWSNNDFVLIHDATTNKASLVQVKEHNQNISTVLQHLDSTKEVFTLDQAKHKVLGVLIEAKHNYK